MRFELKEEHIKLLRAAFVRWEDCETGAPAIDCKRPYGNSSGIADDVADAIGATMEKCPHCDEPLRDADRAALMDLHRQTLPALQVMLACGAVELGVYELAEYGRGAERA